MGLYQFTAWMDPGGCLHPVVVGISAQTIWNAIHGTRKTRPVPEDKNDHTINANQYRRIPYGIVALD